MTRRPNTMWHRPKGGVHMKPNQVMEFYKAADASREQALTQLVGCRFVPEARRGQRARDRQFLVFNSTSHMESSLYERDGHPAGSSGAAMNRHREVEGAAQDIAQSCGAAATIERRGRRHTQAILRYGDRQRFIVLSATPSDTNAPRRAAGDARRALRKIGAPL